MKMKTVSLSAVIWLVALLLCAMCVAVPAYASEAGQASDEGGQTANAAESAGTSNVADTATPAAAEPAPAAVQVAAPVPASDAAPAPASDAAAGDAAPSQAEEPLAAAEDPAANAASASDDAQAAAPSEEAPAADAASDQAGSAQEPEGENKPAADDGAAADKSNEAAGKAAADSASAAAGKAAAADKSSAGAGKAAAADAAAKAESADPAADAAAAEKTAKAAGEGDGAADKGDGAADKSKQGGETTEVAQASSKANEGASESDKSTNWARLSGNTALDTMQKVAQTGFSTSSSVVLAGVDSYQDALSASPLAGMLKAPVLLTEAKSLSNQTASELKRLGTSKVYIIGGKSVVNEKVRQQILKLGLAVERISGNTATQTADAVAKKLGSNAGDTCIVATVNGFEDALSIAPYAYSHIAPIFLSESKSGLTSASQALVRSGKYARGIIVGGKNAVPRTVESQLAKAGVSTVKRLEGNTAYDTSAAVADWSVAEGMTRENMGVATGRFHQDAVSGAAMCGKNNAVLVLADDANRTAVRKTYRNHINDVSKGYVFGGTAVVSVVTWEYLHRPIGSTTLIASERTVSDGLYGLFETAKGFSIDVAGNNLNVGANVQMYGWNQSLAQKWQITWRDRGYAIRSLGTGHYLAVKNGSMVSGANVVQVGYKADDAQLWAISKNASGKYVIRNLKSGMALEAKGAPGNGANAQVGTPNGAAKQSYNINPTEPLVDGGVYTLYMNNGKTLAMDDPDYSTAKNRRMQVFTANKSSAQKFVARRVGKNVYTLQPLASGLFLQDSGGVLNQVGRSGGLAQQWTVEMATGGAMLVNVYTGKAMTHSSDKKGVKMSTSKAANKASQRMVIGRVDPVENGTYVIRSQIGNRALNVDGNIFSNKANLTIRSANGSWDQAFTITKSGKYYRITNVLSNRAVEVASGSSRNGANVQQYAKANVDAQLWEVVVADDCSLMFVNKASGKALDVVGGRNANGANVQSYARNNTASQKWRLVSDNHKADAAVTRAGNMLSTTSSPTNYLIAVDKTAHKVVVFTGGKGNWRPQLISRCSIGSRGNPTPSGTFYIGSRGYSFGHGYTCYYWTQIIGDYLFHSTKYVEGTFKHLDSRLGRNISLGCVRLPIDNAKWINQRVPSSTKVRIYN